GRPRLGVKCGCNDAFVVTVLETSGTVAEIRDGTGHRAEIEAHLLRPLLRGETLSRWHSASADEHIIWTHDVTGSPLASLPPLASRWFARRRRELSARADARHAARFWSLFRIDAAAMDRPRAARMPGRHRFGHRSAQHVLCGAMPRSHRRARAHRSAQWAGRAQLAERRGGAGARRIPPVSGLDALAFARPRDVVSRARHSRAPRRPCARRQAADR